MLDEKDKQSKDLLLMTHKHRIFADCQQLEVILGEGFHGIDCVEDCVRMRASLACEEQF